MESLQGVRQYLQQTLEIITNMERLDLLSFKEVLPMVSNASMIVSFGAMVLSLFTGVDGLGLEYFQP